MTDHGVGRADVGIGPQDGSSELNDTVRRRAYLLVPGLLVALLVVMLVIDGFGVPYWGVAYPILVVLLAAMFVGVWRRWLSLWGFELGLMVVVVTPLLGFLATWRLAPAYVAAEAMDIYLVMLWSGLAFPLAFLTLGTRRGLQVSIGIYSVFVLLVVPPIADAGLPAETQLDSATTHLSLAVFFAVIIVLLWVLASRLEALGMARAAARLFASQASTDALTGMPNRRQLDDQLDREIARARRHRMPLSVLLVDIDRFKTVNDRYGHQAGDRALCELASRLSGTVRGGDLAGRWGGEEFLVIAPNTGHDAALQLAERCRTAISDVAGVGKLTASIGVATLVEHEDARSLVRRADTALYRAKDGGRDAVIGIRECAISAEP
jgi:diguanylate cyclase (GGDEF)-like protein